MEQKEKKMKENVCLILAFFLLVGMMLLPAEKVLATESTEYGKQLATGTCGATGNEDNILWTVYDSGEDGTESKDTGDLLVLSGTGDMMDFTHQQAPWYSFAESLTTVKFTEESQITHIGNYSFYLCEVLSGITIPDNVSSIGQRAFMGCDGLSSIIIPDSVSSIDDSAFYNCEGLSSVTISGNVSSMGEDVFCYCKKLNSVTLKKGITMIGKNAFCGCKELSSVTLEKGITMIGDRAFCECEKLSSITIPESVTTIGEYAFKSCSSLSNIMIPASVTNIGRGSFAECGQLTLQVSEDNANYSLENGVLYDKGKSILLSCPKASENIVIPDSVTRIESDAFNGCSSLKSITLPKGITTIGEYAFANCSSLESITLHEGITAIENYAFSYCRNLTAIKIPDSVTKIGIKAFFYCINLSNITLPDSLQSLGLGAFHTCKKLSSITIPEGITFIGEMTFYDCSSLSSITIPDSVTYMSTYVFYGCENLSNVTLSKNIGKIGKGTFQKCENLSSITLPKNLTTLKENSFGGCTSLKSIVLPEGVTSIDSTAFYGCTNLGHIYYPSGFDISGLQASDNQLLTDSISVEAGYEMTEDNTIAVTVQKISEGTTMVTVPKTIMDKPIASVKFAEGVDKIGISIMCTSHYFQPEITEEGHGYASTNCTVCEKKILVSAKTPHDFSDGTQPCTCGYVPFQITTQPCGGELIYEYEQGLTLSVEAQPTLHTEQLSYQWYEGGNPIEGAVGSTYTIPIGKWVRGYTYYCEISCGEYCIDSETVRVSVEKKEKPDNTPGETKEVENQIKKVSEISLPDGWEWAEEDRDKTLAAGESIEATAEFVKAVKIYYEITAQKITITRAACESSEILYTGEGEKAPNCTEGGLGHKKCFICDDILERNITTAALGHNITKIEKIEATCTKTGNIEYWSCLECKKNFSDKTGKNEITDARLLIIPVSEHCGGTATCSKKAVCDICQEEYGELDGTNHIGTEVRNEKSATCAEEGYTGDVYCKDCGIMVSSGEIVEKSMKHTWDQGVVLREATCTESDKIRYTCSVCGGKKTVGTKILEHSGGEAGCTDKAICDTCQGEYGELDKTNHKKTEIRNKKEATCKEEGYTGDMYCKDCGEKLSEGEKEAKLNHTWDEGVVTKPATETEKGIKTYTCSGCKENKTEEIPAQGKTEVPEGETTPEVPEGETTPEVPKTEATPKPTQTPSQGEMLVVPKKGTILFDKKNQVKYKILVPGPKNATVEYLGLLNKKAKKAYVPAKVKINGITYKVVSIGKNAFKNHKYITKVTIGNNVKSIGANAFYGCKKLKKVSIGKNVTTIGVKAFYKCTALTKITIPSKVKKIGKQAFYGDKKLKTITIKTKKLTKKNVGSKALKGIHKKATIKVPKSKVKTYQKMLKTKGIGKKVKVKK